VQKKREVKAEVEAVERKMGKKREKMIVMVIAKKKTKRKERAT